MRLYRPVGIKELEKIEALEMKGYPPRLPDQPIFYPVLTFDYAAKIARDWNSLRADHDHLGFVTEFDIDDKFISQYKIEQAASRDHEEYWIPAEDLNSFNQALTSKIYVTAKYVKGERVTVFHGY